MNPCSLDHIILSIPALLNVKKHLGLTRLELVTSCLSGTRSNHLSYSPFNRYIGEEKSYSKQSGSLYSVGRHFPCRGNAPINRTRL